MEKQDIIQLLNEIFIPIKFKRKGNNWVLNGSEISKIINLQRSQYSNAYYINYGFVIKSIPLERLFMHIFKGLGSFDANENKRIRDLLNFENDISDEDRITELKYFITEKVLSNMMSISNEEDILHDLKSMPNLNTIPYMVKKHFNLD